MNTKNILTWILRIVPAVILLQTLFFKFSAHPDSVKLFETLGMEPFGRIGTGVVELIAGILLLIPRYTGIGAILGLGVISGAILSHLTILGIEFNEDGGTLFGMAVVVFITTAILTWMERKNIPVVKNFFQ